MPQGLHGLDSDADQAEEPLDDQEAELILQLERIQGEGVENHFVDGRKTRENVRSGLIKVDDVVVVSCGDNEPPWFVGLVLSEMEGDKVLVHEFGNATSSTDMTSTHRRRYKNLKFPKVVKNTTTGKNDTIFIEKDMFLAGGKKRADKGFDQVTKEVDINAIVDYGPSKTIINVSDKLKDGVLRAIHKNPNVKWSEHPKC